VNAVSTQKRKYELKARAEAQEATRARIAAAAASLHEEVGVGKTTVADIARRAGVQRLTVYNHFPDLHALLPACTSHWLAEHPMPDLSQGSLEQTLAALYGWYRETAPMQERVNGERTAVPELDAWLARSADVALAALADRLSTGASRPLIALALEFWTWRRLAREGLSDEQAAALMAGVAARTSPQER
jgi:AcrR family transcriptional regulator